MLIEARVRRPEAHSLSAGPMPAALHQLHRPAGGCAGKRWRRPGRPTVRPTDCKFAAAGWPTQHPPHTHAQVVKAGRRIATIDVSLRDESTGEVVATGTHVKYVAAAEAPMGQQRAAAAAAAARQAAADAPPGPRSRL